MNSNISSTTPAQNPDGTLSAIVHSHQSIPPAGTILRCWMPLTFDAGGGFGRYFLVRCAEDTPQARGQDWSIYARRALFCASLPVAMPNQPGSHWELLVPHEADPGYQWLLRQRVGSSLNLLGPFGQRFVPATMTRTLAIITDPDCLPLTIPVVQDVLDRGGRVTLLIRGGADLAASLLPLVPIPVEIQFIPSENWLNHLSNVVRWADQLCAVLPNADYAPLAHAIRTLRFQLDATYAHVLVASDLLCGVGACLACVVATREGSYTRACMHGPVMPLAAIAG